MRSRPGLPDRVERCEFNSESRERWAALTVSSACAMRVYRPDKTNCVSTRQQSPQQALVHSSTRVARIRASVVSGCGTCEDRSLPRNTRGGRSNSEGGSFPVEGWHSPPQIRLEEILRTNFFSRHSRRTLPFADCLRVVGTLDGGVGVGVAARGEMGPHATRAWYGQVNRRGAPNQARTLSPVLRTCREER